MNDRRKTKAQLIEELEALRLQLTASADPGAPSPAAPDPEVLQRFASRGAWLVDTDFVVRVANEAMCQLLNKRADEVVGCKCYELMSSAGCHTEACAMRRAFAEASSVAAKETRTIGSVPLACRVVAHLVHDTGKEAVGIVERLDHAGEASEPTPRPSPAPKQRNVAAVSVPTAAEAVRLAEAAQDIVAYLRGHVADEDLAERAERLEQASLPWKEHAASTTRRSKSEGKRALHEIAPERSVLMIAPPGSQTRCAWADVVRRAGYAVLTPRETEVLTPRQGKDSLYAGPGEPAPTVAILDLALGESITEELHQHLRQGHPHMPIVVVSSSDNGALEARRWRRSCTWYVPRAVGGDELVRLVEELSPRPVLRSRPER